MKKIALLLSIIMMAVLCGCENAEKSVNKNYDPYTYDGDSPIVYQSGVARVWQINNDSYLYGYIDESGKVIIPCIYEGTSNDIYEGKYIIVKKDNKYGIITTDGKMLEDCKYDYIYIEEGKANLDLNGEQTTIDLGIERIDKELDEVSEIVENIELE